jgi:hypothetical protein
LTDGLTWEDGGGYKRGPFGHHPVGVVARLGLLIEIVEDGRDARTAADQRDAGGRPDVRAFASVLEALGEGPAGAGRG